MKMTLSSAVRCVLMFISATSLAVAAEGDTVRWRCVEEELRLYPAARLTDLYKNMFQDAFGPGHLIPDTARAGAYLDWELQQPEWRDTLVCQPLGVNHDFFRVNLLLVKQGTIPRDTLIAAMAVSARMARAPGLEQWKKEWALALAYIRRMHPALPGMKEDAKRIASALKAGETALHHSPVYEKAYAPHYRIIHRSIIERWRGRWLPLSSLLGSPVIAR